MEMSASIAELAKALVKAQAAMKPVLADSENPYFKSKYADLAAVWENCRKPLTDNGLSVVQVMENGENGKVTVKTILLHESGEWISGSLSLTPVKTDPQSIGSAITYGRRYSLAAMVGVCAEEEDDDANAASHKEEPKYSTSKPAQMQPRPQQQTQQQPQAPKMATEPQQKRLFARAREVGLGNEELKDLLKEKTGKESTRLLTMDEIKKMFDAIESIEEKRAGVAS